jgi:hypothetical protein
VAVVVREQVPERQEPQPGAAAQQHAEPPSSAALGRQVLAELLRAPGLFPEEVPGPAAVVPAAPRRRPPAAQVHGCRLPAAR